MQKLVFRNGEGTEIDLTSGNYGIVNWSGLSECSQEIQSQQVPFNDGSVFLDNLLGEREMTFTIAINDDKDLHKRYELKRELISILNQKLKEGYLIYTNDFLSRQIKCIPDLPIFENKNFNDTGTLKAELVFTANNPYWEDIEETEIILNPSLTEIENKGDVETTVKMEIKTRNQRNIKLTNNGDTIDIGSEELNGLYEINTGKGEKNFSEIWYSERKISTPDPFKYYRNIFDTQFGVFCKYTNDWKTNAKETFFTNDFQNFTAVNSGVMVYNPNKNLVVLSCQNGIYTTSDGINYTSIDSEVDGLFLFVLCFDGEKYIAIALSLDFRTLELYTSTDLENWEKINANIPELWTRDGFNYLPGKMYYNETSKVYAVVSNGYNRPAKLYTSTDLENWEIALERIDIDNAGDIIQLSDGTYILRGDIDTISESNVYSTTDFINFTLEIENIGNLNFYFGGEDIETHNYYSYVYSNDDYDSYDYLYAYIRDVDGNWTIENNNHLHNKIIGYSMFLTSTILTDNPSNFSKINYYTGTLNNNTLAISNFKPEFIYKNEVYYLLQNYKTNDVYLHCLKENGEDKEIIYLGLNVTRTSLHDNKLMYPSSNGFKILNLDTLETREVDTDGFNYWGTRFMEESNGVYISGVTNNCAVYNIEKDIFYTGVGSYGSVISCYDGKYLLCSTGYLFKLVDSSHELLRVGQIDLDLTTCIKLIYDKYRDIIVVLSHPNNSTYRIQFLKNYRVIKTITLDMTDAPELFFDEKSDMYLLRYNYIFYNGHSTDPIHKARWMIRYFDFFRPGAEMKIYGDYIEINSCEYKSGIFITQDENYNYNILQLDKKINVIEKLKSNLIFTLKKGKNSIIKVGDAEVTLKFKNKYVGV